MDNINPQDSQQQSSKNERVVGRHKDESFTFPALSSEVPSKIPESIMEPLNEIGLNP